MSLRAHISAWAQMTVNWRRRRLRGFHVLNKTEIKHCRRSSREIKQYFISFLQRCALLAMQSTVIATAIPSLRLSHAGIVHRRMNIGSQGLQYEVAKHSSFLIPTIV